jgi:hypothetical protein
MAVSLGTLNFGAWLRGGLPRELAASGLLVAMALAALSLPEFRGPELMPVAVAVSALSAWMLIAGFLVPATAKGGLKRWAGGAARGAARRRS